MYIYVYDYRKYLYNIECVLVVCLRKERVYLKECLLTNQEEFMKELVGCAEVIEIGLGVVRFDCRKLGT